MIMIMTERRFPRRRHKYTNYLEGHPTYAKRLNPGGSTSSFPSISDTSHKTVLTTVTPASTDPAVLGAKTWVIFLHTTGFEINRDFHRTSSAGIDEQGTG